MNSDSKPYTIYTVERPRRPRRRLRTALIVLAVVVAVLAVGACASYVWFDRLVAATHNSPAQSAAVSVLQQSTTYPPDSSAAAVAPDAPGTMDIILFGSDSSQDGDDVEEYGRSDTIMLVHVDSKANFLSVLSLPRDLRVEVPGYGLEKLNAAYAYGGPALAIETVQNLIGLDLDHYVNIDFDAFRRVTTELGGVWIDVDRHYYHQSQAGDAEYHENLDIPAGYQRLMGEDALDFVRFRVDSNGDFGRMQRQQLFVREAKRQFVNFGTALKVPEIAGLVAQNVTTSLYTNDVISLAFWVLRLDGSRMKQLSLNASTEDIDGVSYVIASEDSIAKVVSEYKTAPVEQGTLSTEQTAETETSEGAAPASGSSNRGERSAQPLLGARVEVMNGTRRTGQAAAAAAMLRAAGATIVTVGNAEASQQKTEVAYPPGQEAAASAAVEALGLGYSSVDGDLDCIKVTLGSDFFVDYDQVTYPGPSGIIYEDEYQALQTMVVFPLLGPTYVPEGYRYADRRVYEIDAGTQGMFPAVKTIYKYGVEDQYLGIMQTTFVDAPAAAAGQSVTIGGVTYTAVDIAGATDRIWWKKDGVLYWVSNTLSHLVSRDDLLRVAAGMVPVPEQ